MSEFGCSLLNLVSDPDKIAEHQVHFAILEKLLEYEREFSRTEKNHDHALSSRNSASIAEGSQSAKNTEHFYRT